MKLKELEIVIKRAKEQYPILGCAKNVFFPIDLASKEPISQQPYKVPHIMLEPIKKEIQPLLKLKVIRESNSYYGAPAFSNLKKSSVARVIIDCRKLNGITKKLAYPFPDIETKFRSLKGARIFSTLDLNNGYYQIKIKKEDILKTAVVTEFGQFEWTRAPFGLVNPPRFFTKYMSTVLKDLDFEKVFVDDVLIFSKDLEEHVSHVKKVLDMIFEAGLSINFEKSVFARKEVKYLGCLIGDGELKPDKTEFHKLEKYIKVTKKKDLQRLLGFLNWHRRFLLNLSTKLIQITNKLKDHVTKEFE